MKKKSILLLFYLMIISPIKAQLLNSLPLEYNNLKLQKSNANNISPGYEEISLLEHGFYPNAQINSLDEAIVCAIRWIIPYSATAQKIDKEGNLLWTDNRFGVFLTRPESDGDGNLRTPLILPSPDGGAFFAFGYSEWVEGTHGPLLFKTYPHIQKVSPSGIVEWGRNGIRLSDELIHVHGGATVLSLDYTGDGNIIIYWEWFDIDSLGQRYFGTFGQKIDTTSGNIHWGKTGKKFLNTSAWKSVKCIDFTLLIHNDSVLCVEKNGAFTWDLPLLNGIGIQDRYIIAANDFNELFMLYENSNKLMGRLFDSNGKSVWYDVLVLSNVELHYNSFITNWGNNKWLIIADNNFHCITRSGSSTWGDEGLALPDSVDIYRYNAKPIDNNSFFCLSLSKRQNSLDLCRLYLSKMDINGEYLWDDHLLFISDHVDQTNHILVDQSKGAFIIFQAAAIYSDMSYIPIRQRGTYAVKVNKDGIRGFITNIAPDKKASQKRPVFNTFNLPNPFNDKTNIVINEINPQLQSELTVIIYDILGKEVREFYKTEIFTSSLTITWDRKDKLGRRVPNGIYFYQVINGNKLFGAGKLLVGGVR